MLLKRHLLFMVNMKHRKNMLLSLMNEGFKNIEIPAKGQEYEI